MDLYNNIDFCIISKPYDDAVDYIVFLTRRGFENMDIELLKDVEYGDVAKEMVELGFFEMEEGLTFEVTDNVLSGKYTQKKIKRLLESKGMKYSFKLEQNINKEFELLSVESREKIKNAMSDLYESNELFIDEKDELDRITSLNSNFYPQEQIPTFSSSVSKNKVPEINETITLNIYLFLQCAFTSSDNAVLELNGSFDSKANSSDKNFIKIIEVDFKRVKNINPGVIQLECVKKFKDILEDIDILFQGFFEYKKAGRNEEGKLVMKNKTFKYSIFDVITSLNPLTQITFEVNESVYFDRMIEMSNKIREERVRTEKRQLPIDSIRLDLEDLCGFLEGKMNTYAEDEEFEKAGKFKQDLAYAQDRLDYVNETENKTMSTEEYFKFFSLPKR